MRRYLILVSAVLMQLALGGIYAWSTFVAPLRANYGLATWQTQLIFGLSIVFFVLTMLVAGKLLDRKGPRLPAMIGGVLFLAGLVVASLSKGNFVMLLLGYGVISGTGIGFAYLCPIGTAARWFPKHKGLITGVAVAGFGGGAMVLALLAKSLMAGGMDVLEVFRWVGLGYGAVVILAGLMLVNPPGAKLAHHVEKQPKISKDPRFWRIFGAMFAGTFAGLLIIGNLEPMGLVGGVDPLMAASAVGILALGNAAGRVLWGLIADKFGRRFSSITSLILLGASIVILPLSAGWGVGFLVFSALVGFNFGAAMVLYATQTSDIYGAEHFGRIYAFVGLSYGISGLTGPVVGGAIYDLTGGYWPAIIVATTVSVAGALFYYLMGRHVRRHEELQKAPETA